MLKRYALPIYYIYKVVIYIAIKKVQNLVLTTYTIPYNNQVLIDFAK